MKESVLPTTYKVPPCVAIDHEPTMNGGAVVCANCDVVLITREGMKALHKLALFLT